jgi:hypothetical protein
MPNYVLAYTGGSEPQSDEQMKAVLDAWSGWFGRLGDAVVDGGNPFGPSKSIAPDGSVSDGGASSLTGYSVLRADSLDAATALAKDCPQLGSGGSVEVYETFDVM